MGDDRGLTIRLLGGVAAIAGDGRPVDVGPAKCQTVLAALALSAGSAVPMTRLIELVWGVEPPRSAERTLQSYVARLRRSLGPESITRQGGSYRLEVGPAAVDAVRFGQLLDAGRVEEALAEWAGPPLGGLEAAGLAPVVTALEERWMAAVESDLERRVERDPVGAVAELTELTAHHPFREGLWALLMTALYRSGRQADALAAYRAATGHLGDRLGLDPGPRLRDLELMILGHDERLDPGDRPPSGRPTGTVTFAFTEVDGLAGLRSADPEGAAAALAEHHRRIHELAARHRGAVFSAVDDRFGLAFHRPADAAAWAAALHAAAGRDRAGGPALEVRVGIHSGEAEEHERGYFGPAVNLAARLAGIGHGGQSLVSEAGATLLDGVELRELGTFRLEGIVAEQRIHQVGDRRHPPLRTERRRPGNAPRRLARVIGRDEMLAGIGRALADYPLVTLVGPGGIGKTTVALAAATRRAGGDRLDGRGAGGPGAGGPQGEQDEEADEEVWIVELAEVRSAEHVPRAVADTLAVLDRADSDLTRTVVDWLRPRRALLVLDNCEHVIEAVADLADAVVRHCEGVRLLATSRERLGLGHERIVTVEPLDPRGSAAELFVERAAAVTPVFEREAAWSEVTEICRRLDGIPLAVELAAARVGSLSTAELLERLDRDEGLRLLAGGRRSDAGDRHQTLRAAVDWSYDLLEAQEQLLFQRLSVFTGFFDRAAAEAVAADDDLDPLAVDRLLGDLVDRSMAVNESGPFGRRFRLLEPMREYGAERLAAGGQAAVIAGRHTDWCLNRVRHIGGLLAGWDEIEGVARLEELWPNLRATFDRTCDRGDLVLGRELVRPILGEIVLRSQNEIGDWIERLLAMTPPDDRDGLIFGLYWAAHRYAVSQDPDGYQRLLDRYGEPDHLFLRHGRAFVSRDYETMVECMPEVAAELRRLGDPVPAERAEISLATALLHTRRFTEHQRVAARLVERYQEQGPPTFLNWALTSLGYGAAFQGRFDRADAWFDQAIDVAVPPRTHTPSRAHEARRVFRSGDHVRAYRILRAHVRDIVDTDNMQAGLTAIIEYIDMMTALGRLPEAARMVNHLETTGLLDGPGWRGLIPPDAIDAAEADAARGGHEPERDRRRTLALVARDLEDLIEAGGRG